MSQYKDVVQEIKEKVNIVDAIGRIIPLKNSGRSYSGLCPFHKETDGSFHVYEETQTYICFGCGAKGDVISFYMQYYNEDFSESIEKFCKEYGIEQKSYSYNHEKKENLDPLYDVNVVAGKLYYENIWNEGNPGLKYLLGRSLDEKTIKKFRIGYADGSGTIIYDAIKQDDNKVKAAKEVGLVRDDKGKIRDKYFNRVMFPIINDRNKVIGFGGRDITDKSKAKYINSDASKIFEKGRNLFGLNVAKGDIKSKGEAIVVEGYMDVVALYMHGIHNAVAVLGTAFTEQQAKLLKRWTPSVVLSMDSDESGLAAAEKSCDILNKAGIRVRVLIIEDAKDPDEFIKKKGLSEFEAAVENAMPMYDFKLSRLRKNYNLEASDEMSAYLSKASELISGLSPIEQDYYVQMLSDETKISPDAIYRQINMNGPEKPERKIVIEKKIGIPKDTGILQKTILCLILQSDKYLDRVSEYRHIFDNSEYYEIFSAILYSFENKEKDYTDVDVLSSNLDDENAGKLKKLSSEINTIIGHNPDVQFDDCLRQIQIKMLHENYDKLVPLLNGTGEATEVLIELEKIQRRIRELSDNK